MRSAPAIFPQLTLQTASKHLDRRALRRICEIEADNLGGLARRCVVELEDRVPGRFEETVAGFEQLNRLAFQLKMKASGRHHPHSRDRMAMQSSRLPRREFDPCAFDQAHGRVRGRQLLFQERFAFERREGRVGHGGVYCRAIAIFATACFCSSVSSISLPETSTVT
jgi:hypothetical protein